MLRRVPRDVLVERPSGLSGDPVFELSRPFSEIVAEYGARAPDDVATVIMTGVEEAGSG